MTLENQRIAIAGACGWKAKHRSDICDGVRIIKCGACGASGHSNCYGNGTGQIQFTCAESPCCEDATPPDYPEDLNATEKARHSLPKDRVTLYHEILYKLCGGLSGAIDATSQQRAEALLKTFGKWRDE